MQILKLELEGIGPFTGHHTIDFRALGAGGLFLMEGPTGSGKTTIIDAIVFALYGDVAGSDSSKARLVSTLLRPGTEPSVNLTVETSRGLLRVHRVPQYTRRKSRGSGTTVGKASIKLWRLAHPDDEGVLLSTSLQDASEELQRAIGLTKEQFTQTVVLPQGHFATFLRAKPEERRTVLQDIFGTEFYERCARQLAESAAGLRARDADARAALDRAASSFAMVAWAADDPARAGFEGAAAGDPGSAVEVATARVGELEESAAASEAAASEAAALSRGAEADLRAVVDRNEAIAEHARLRARLAELSDAAGAVAEAEAVLGAAERAEHARHPLDARAKAKSGFDTATADAARAVGRLTEGPDADLVADGVDPDALDAAAMAAREGRSALTVVVELEGGLASRAESLRLDVSRLATRRADARRARERIDSDRAAASELVPELDALAAIADTRADCVAAEVEARVTCEAIRRLESVAEEFIEARRAEQRASEEAAEASERHAAARAAWLGGLAGRLAEELVAGEPCPVCGSTRHPAPATRPTGSADRAEVERLEALASKAGKALAAAQARSDSLATAMSDQQAVVGDLTRLEAEVALAEASEAKRTAELASAQAAEVRARIEGLLAGASEREARVHEAEQHLAADKGNLAARTDRLEQDRQRIAEELQGHASVADRVAALARRAEHARRVAVAVRGAGDARSELARREAELAQVLAEQGFADADAAGAALLPAAERGRLARLVGDHRTQFATLTERLGDLRYVGLAGAQASDEAPLRSASELARARLAEALAACGAATSGVRLAREASGELARCASELAALRDAAEPYLRMADLANGVGANLDSVTLPTFVLLRRFEEVVDLANVRLDAMTGGRYALRRTDAREGRSHKLGLGLEVVDHASGDATRDPKTLSGGETFQASLAMALGLADAVTAEAGGIELSTLFVDEGFGSLDPEALDMVMDQLTALRDGGRSVGVVSHVADMKQRIAERVTVIPRRDGTSTLSCSTDPQPALAG